MSGGIDDRTIPCPYRGCVLPVLAHSDRWHVEREQGEIRLREAHSFASPPEDDVDEEIEEYD